MAMKKSESVFVDADAIVALNFYNHPTYKKAIFLAEQIDKLSLQVFTCTYALLEAATVINMRFEGKRGPDVVQELLSNPKISVVKGDAFLGRGLEVMKNLASKNVSLNDCVYFSIVDEFEIDWIFSFDKHWKKAGFNLLF